MHARVVVTLRAGVLDPAGQAVADGLEQLGFSEVRGVRIGKAIDIELAPGIENARARLEEMSARLLANPVIEDFTIELLGEDEPG